MIKKSKCDVIATFSKGYFAVDINRSKCLHATSSKVLFCTHYISNVIYHIFSHNDVSYRFNGENVNVMLELQITFYGSAMGSP